MSEPHHIEPFEVPIPNPQPFLKWVGGKRQLMGALLKKLPQRFNRYHEPFLGGGALFFSTLPDNASLSDLNSNLIETYCVVRSDPEGLIESLSKHIYEKEYFYRMRSMDRDASFSSLTPLERASRFIYLNKTCFNGLYRVNQDGYFNVPFGKYSNPRILIPDNIRACARALRSATISCGGFDKVLDATTAGDFVYLDPPYAPLSSTSNFTSYQERGFSIEDQHSLKIVCDSLSQKGVKWMQSNSSAPLILDLYRDYTIETVPAIRAINSKGSKRGVVEECIITNYDC